jgi:carboxylesterase type B
MYTRLRTFALAGDFVLVAPNYRLNAFGFLAHVRVR